MAVVTTKKVVNSILMRVDNQLTSSASSLGNYRHVRHVARRGVYETLNE